MLRHTFCCFVLLLTVLFALFAIHPAATQGNRPDLIWMRGGTRGIPRALAYSADGKLLASGDSSGAVKIWRMADKMLLRTFRHTNEVLSVSFSPDGKFVASVGKGENAVRVWHIGDGTLKNLASPFAKVLSVAISPDGQTLAAGCDGGHIALWRWPDGTTTGTLSHLNGDVSFVTFSPNGQYFAAGIDNPPASSQTIRLWRMTDSHYMGEFAAARPQAVAFSPNSQILATSNGLWNTSDGSLIRSHEARGRSVAFSPDGQTVVFAVPDIGVTGVYGGHLSFVRVSDDVTIRSVQVPGDYGPVSLAASPNSPDLAVGNYPSNVHGEQGELRLWNWSEATWSYQVYASFSQTAVTFSSDSQVLAVGNVYSGFSLFRASDGTMLKDWGGGAPVLALTSIPNSDLFVVSSNRETLIRRFSDGALVRRLTDRGYSRIAVSPDGETLAAGDWPSTRVDLWRISDGTSLGSFSIPSDNSINGVTHLAFSPDGRTLAITPLFDSRVVLYDTSPLQLRTVLSLPSFGQATSLAFSPDGQILATGDSQGEIDLWHVGEGSHWISFGNSYVYALAFAPDGLTLASLDQQGLRIWSAENGRLLDSYNQETGPIDSGDRILQYSPDDKMIAYGRSDGTICTVLNPYGPGIHPRRGGNTGNVTFKIVTHSIFPVPDGATVILRDGVHPDITAHTTNVNDNPHVLTGTFSLNGAPLGKRDVVITKPNGEKQTYPQGFMIEQGIVPQIVTEIIGRDSLRAGRRQNYVFAFENTGNFDAELVTAYIAFPKFMTGEIEPELQANAFPVPDDEDTIIAVDLPLIPANSIRQISVSLIASDLPDLAHRHFHLHSWGGQIRLISGRRGPFGSGDWRHAVDLILEWAGHVSPYTLEEPLGTIADVGIHADRILICGMIAYIGLKRVKCLEDWAADPLMGDPEVDYKWEGRCNALYSALIRLKAAAGCRCDGDCSDKPGEVITSGDPNDIAGTQGFGDAHWITSTQPLQYTIYFENEREVNGGAQDIVVLDHLDVTALDMTTLSLGPITVGEKRIEPTIETSPPVGQRQFSYTYPYDYHKPDGTIVPLTITVDASLDMLTGDLVWHFSACDQNGNCPPEDAYAGVLPPNVHSPEGEGSVSFTVLPKQNVVTGTVLPYQATVIFDGRPLSTPDPLPTGRFNTIDSDKPISKVQALAAMQSNATFTVRWQATDVGSGVRDVIVSVSEDGGPFMPWLTDTTETQATFLGESGHTYAFKVRGRDNVYNLEEEHAQPDAITQVQANITLRGKIELQEATGGALQFPVEFRPLDGSGNFTRLARLNKGMRFTMTGVPAKRYRIAIKGAKWLRRVIPVDARQEGSLVDILLLAGDANNDNSVDVIDLDLLIQAFNSDPDASNWNEAADFNCDDSVDVLDLDLLIQNFNLQGDP